MKLFLELGAKVEECQRYLFDNGYSFEDARAYTKMIFEEKGLKMRGYDMSVEKSAIRETIQHLNNSILCQ